MGLVCDALLWVKLGPVWVIQVRARPRVIYPRVPKQEPDVTSGSVIWLTARASDPETAGLRVLVTHEPAIQTASDRPPAIKL